MNEISWVGFGISSTVTKTFLHSMPLSLGVGAPYPVSFDLTVGGNNSPGRTVKIEGARLSHPDGFILEEAMPVLKQQIAGPYYVKIDLSPVNQRFDLSASRIMFEIHYQQSSVRYSPVYFCEDNCPVTGQPQVLGFALRDPNLYASLALINVSGSKINLKVFPSPSNQLSTTIQLEPDSVKEFELAELGLTNPQRLDCTWGSLELELFGIDVEPVSPTPAPAGIDSKNAVEEKANQKQANLVAAYMLYRDRNSRRITSIVPVQA